MLNKIREVLLKLGIKQNDNLMIHADFSFLLGRGTKSKIVYSELFNFLSEMVEDGNFLIPSFTYNFCNTRVFDLKKTPSETGMFANYLIKHELISRTSHPIFSFVISGKDAKKISSGISNDAFGKGSIFESMHKVFGCKIVFINADFQYCTYCHYVEQKNNVKYRFLKSFPGRIIDGDQQYEDDFTYNVRSLDGTVITDLSRLKSLLTKKNVFKTISNDSFNISLIDVNDFVTYTEQYLRDDEHILLKDIK